MADLGAKGAIVTGAALGLGLATAEVLASDGAANLASFLASDKAGFITGITIQVDGGLTARFPTYADELAARAGACPRNQPRRSSR
jgi:NAD(P)-dependent dehydrogenase (short-subunit alcohol dehydrogenase family)